MKTKLFKGQPNVLDKSPEYGLKNSPKVPSGPSRFLYEVFVSWQFKYIEVISDPLALLGAALQILMSLSNNSVVFLNSAAQP